MEGNQHSPAGDALTSDRWRRICAVIDRVLDAEPSDQESVLEDACRVEGVAIADAARYLAAARDDASSLKPLDPVVLSAVLGAVDDDRRSLAEGACLGQYEVVAPIGVGGMAEVYRARDTTLHREVALKVLPQRFAIDAERLMRFKREALVLASLNHPNIAAIYGFEEFPSTAHPGQTVLALALELVEGPTLAHRLADGAVARPLALSIAHQIIDSLEAAHDAGIVHRDLKPANIKLRQSQTGRSPDVVVKVLDFGVAKVLKSLEPDIHSSKSINHDTNDSGTRLGTMVGTAAYMSPEQIDGRSVDQRADIWAFGCVLFEMLTGGRVFNGSDVSATLDRIANSDPDWSRLPADTPASLRRLLRRCLEKDRRRRLAHVADARLDIDEAESEPAARPHRLTSGRSLRTALLVGAAAVLAIAATIAGWLFGRQAPSAPALVTRLSIPIAGNIDQPAVSPDGSQVAFVSRIPTRRIVLRRLDHSEEQSVPGTEDATAPTFSPAGTWLAYRTTVQMEGAEVSRLKKIPVTGGAAVTLVDSVLPSGGDVLWGDDDYIYYAEDGVVRVAAAGGTPQRVVVRDQRNGELGLSNLTLLPGGEWLLFTAFVAPTQAGEPASRRVVAFNLRTGARRVVLPSDGPATYAQTGRDPSKGHLLFERDGSLFAAPFDAKQMSVHNTPIRIGEPVEPASLATNSVVVSKTGTLAYVVRRNDAAVTDVGTLVWVDRHGIETPIPDLPSRVYGAPRISPDGKRAAFNILRPGQRGVLSDIWTYDFDRHRLVRATFDGHSLPRSVVWSRDGRRLIYASRAEGQSAELLTVAADGSGQPAPLPSAPNPGVQRLRVAVPGSVSPDGKFLIGTVSGEARPGVFRLALDTAHASTFEPLLDVRMVERDPQFAPNGRWIAYQSNRSGRREVWVAPHPNPGRRWRQVSIDGGAQPRWSAIGRELFYRGRNSMMAVAIDTATSFQSGTPALLFEGNYHDDYDVAPDGTRFLMIKPDPSAARSNSDSDRELHIVVNWFEELRRRVPFQR